ncbi:MULTISPECIES: lipopolysaccharide biosynthesis protein [unclassified Nitratiruptor]|uniref:lipopolysaccharide biosynthesis protein n=1 Tax=unclassified Nitratiruptor TaxID=2624044 RepID=UPI001915CD68|nr:MULTISPECIES: hypothetical protein [unclassified Nitratiruptor]BCD60569.1 hypothetical protein NitYY0810_C1340 [Nitratiruptor sp. YY08-10]BCD64500.1 hypothetical protein NitYY0814_C1347 [Nitratiruptor sp. YY08-14]
MKKLLLSSSFITVLVMGINFLFKIYLSYKISKHELGLFYTFMDLIAIGVMAFSGFKDSLVKTFDEEYFRGVVYWYLISFWGLFIIVCCFEVVYYTYFFEYKIFPLYYLIIMLFANGLAIFFSYFNASWKQYRVMLFENLFMVLGLVGSFFIFNFFLDDLRSLFIAFVFSYLIKVIFINKFSQFQFNYEKIALYKVRYFFKNNILTALMYFFSGLGISLASLIIIKLFHDIDFLSEYQVVIRSIFFSLVAIFVFPLNSFTFPEISRLVAQGMRKEIKRIDKKLIVYLSIFFLVIVVSLPLTPYMVQYIFPKEYEKSYKMLNLLLPTLPFLAYTTFSLNILKGFNRFDLALKVRVFGFLLFLSVVGLFCILHFDAKSVIYSFIISFLGMFLLALKYKKRLLDENTFYPPRTK